MKTLAILFAGEAVTTTLVDGTTFTVFIRAMPQRYLGLVLESAEWPHALVELCTYLPGQATEEQPPAAHPNIPTPQGYRPVPAGWSDNLTPEAVNLLYEKAKALNFRNAVDWARGQIAAKKLVAPLHEQAIEQVLPVLLRIMEPLMQKLDALSHSMRSAPLSQDGAATNSSTSPSSGSKP